MPAHYQFRMLFAPLRAIGAFVFRAEKIAARHQNGNDNQQKKSFYQNHMLNY